MRTFISFAFTLLSATSFAQQKVVNAESFDIIPNVFTSSNKPVLQFEEENQFAIYDENIELIRQIPLSEHKYEYTLTYSDMEREVKNVNAEVYNKYVYQSFDDNYTYEQFLEEEKNHAYNDFTIVTKKISDNETMLYSYSEKYDYSQTMFFGYSYFGFEYPRRYFIYNSLENVLYQCDVRYTVEYTDWVNKGTRTEKHEVETPIVEIIYRDVDAASCHDGMEFKVSQTLFNDDEEFEYIIPKVTMTDKERGGGPSIDINPSYSEQITLTSSTCTTEKQNPVFTGFQVISSNGSVLHDIDFGENYVLSDYYDPEVRVIKIGGHIYIAADCEERSDSKTEYCTVFYSIDKNTTSVKRLSVAPRKMTVKKNNTDIYVNMTSEDSPSKFVLTDAKGCTIASKNIPAGVSSTTISSTGTNGIYNLTRIKNGKVIDNAKVMLK